MPRTDHSEPVRIDRRTLLRTATAVGFTGGTFARASVPAAAIQSRSGGPVVLLGIDSEDGGVDGHGPIGTYVAVVEDILAGVNNGGDGILVVGGRAASDVTAFWNRIESDTGEAVTYVRGASNIRRRPFDGFAVVAVANSRHQTTGGMSQSENDALVGRSDDVAAFVDGGGGLFGTTQSGFSNAWAYVAEIGTFDTNTDVAGRGYDDVTPTPAGNDIGIVDPDLDLCCWHDTFTQWPDFLDVLAWRAGFEDEQAAALGGSRVTIQAPAAACQVSFPQSVPCVGEPITFDGSGSTDPDGDDALLDYAWDFDGDGTTDATGAVVDHAFATSGQRTAVLTVTDEDRETSTCEVTVDVQSCGPTARCDVSFPESRPCLEDDITFDGSSSDDPDDDPLSYAWDFDGDGTTDATDAVARHRFSTPGRKRAVLTVTDEDDVADTCEATLDVVRCNSDPVAACEVSFAGPEPVTGQPLTFDGSGSQDPDGDPLDYAWDFDGDGTTDATGAVVDHTFATGGRKRVTLTVTDHHGATDTCETTVAVRIVADMDIIPTINPRSQGVIPVRIRRSAALDPVQDVDVQSLRFGDPEDVQRGGGARATDSGHGRMHLMLHFPTPAAGFEGDETVGRLEGTTHDGVPIVAEAAVRFAGGPGRGDGGGGHGRGGGGGPGRGDGGGPGRGRGGGGPGRR